MPIKFDNLLTTDQKKKKGINLNKLLGNADFKPIPKKEIEFTPTNQEILDLGLGPIRPELAKKVIADNSRVEILRKPRAWDQTVEEPKLSTPERVEKSYEDAWARADLNRLMNTPVGKITAKDVIKEYSGKPEKVLPFLSSAKEIQELVKLRGAIKRAETDETTPQDDLLLFKYAQESQRDRTFGGTVASILMGLPSFAGEFLLTGGAYSVGKKAAEKVIEKTFAKYTTKNLSKNVGVKILTGLAGASLQTPLAGVTRIPAETLQNMLPQYNISKGELGTLQFDITQPGDTLSLALAKAYGDQWVELVSERSGGLFNQVGQSARDGLVKTGLLKSFLKANPKATPQVFNQWVKRAGWNGIIAEMGEERVGEGMRAIMGLEEYKAPTPEQLAAELVAFGIPGTAINALGKVDATTDITPQEQETPLVRSTDTTTPPPAASSAVVEPVVAPTQEQNQQEPTINNIESTIKPAEIVAEPVNITEGLRILQSNNNLVSLEEDAKRTGTNLPEKIAVFHGNNTGQSTIELGDFVSLDKNYVELRYKNVVKDLVEPSKLIIPPDSTGETIDEYIYKPTEVAPVEASQLIGPVNGPKTIDENLKEMAKTYNQKSGKLAETKPVDIEGVQRKSRVYDKVRDQIAEEFREDASYNQMNMGQQAAMAINFANNNPALALDVARGIKPPPPNITDTAIAIAVAEQAKERGDDKLRSELIQRRSLRQTRRGQEIVLERTVDPDSADYFIKLALKNKLNADASWTWDEKGSPVKRKAVLETAKREAKVARKTIDRKAAKIASAQKIIDSILC